MSDAELNGIEQVNESVDDDEGKVVKEIKQDSHDIQRVAKGISMDTEGAAEQENAPSDTLDEVGDLRRSVPTTLLTLSPSLQSAPPVRERPAVVEERSGFIQFRVVTNDGAPDSMIILTGLKNIFQRQLPKMPREYITRLVMDRNHWSMAIVKRGLQVVGGITYRPFNHRRFAEIVFCAITSTEQVKVRGPSASKRKKGRTDLRLPCRDTARIS